jgi:hypothetical protein
MLTDLKIVYDEIRVKVPTYMLAKMHMMFIKTGTSGVVDQKPPDTLTIPLNSFKVIWDQLIAASR